MYSRRVKDVMERRKFVKVAPAMTVAKTARLMATKRVGAVVVVEGNTLVGIFTERDALFRVMSKSRDPAVTPVSEVMTRDPKSIGPDESFGLALLVMHDNGFRHLPVVENGLPVGIVSTRSALDPDLEEFRSEELRRMHLRREHGRALARR